MGRRRGGEGGGRRRRGGEGRRRRRRYEEEEGTWSTPSYHRVANNFWDLLWQKQDDDLESHIKFVFVRCTAWRLHMFSLLCLERLLYLITIRLYLVLPRPSVQVYHDGIAVLQCVANFAMDCKSIRRVMSVGFYHDSWLWIGKEASHICSVSRILSVCLTFSSFLLSLSKIFRLNKLKASTKNNVHIKML